MYNSEKKDDTGISRSRSRSPQMSRMDNLGYEDSLDVAFEHNNKLRDKIQQRMRESENLLLSTFGQKCEKDEYEHSVFSHQRHPTNGVVDKALSNLLQENNKHDHK